MSKSNISAIFIMRNKFEGNGFLIEKCTTAFEITNLKVVLDKLMVMQKTKETISLVVDNNINYLTVTFLYPLNTRPGFLMPYVIFLLFNDLR
jgi:hypothetical protein